MKYTHNNIRTGNNDLTADNCHNGKSGTAGALNRKQTAACDICTEILSTTGALNRHKRLRHGIQTPTYGTCCKCHKVLRYGRVLSRHQRNCRYVKSEAKHTGDDSTITCDRCDKVFKSKPKRDKHVSVVHGVGRCKTYDCTRCPLRFSSLTHRSRHEADTHGIGNVITYTCDICFKVLKEERNLKSHKTVVHGIGKRPDYTCYICHKVMHYKGNLRKHVAEVHSSTYVPLLGVLTTLPDKAAPTTKSEVTTETADPSTDINDNTAVADVGDNTCTKTSTSTCTGQHTGKSITTDEQGVPLKKHKCPTCGKAYLFKGMLTRHMQRPCNVFTCPVCAKVFPLKGYLQRHMQNVHVDGWPFPCDQCPKSYKNKGDLRNHTQKVHGMEMTHKCDLCSEVFCAKATRTRHMRKKHGVPERVLPTCKQCSVSFTYTRSLEKHMRTQHNAQPVQLFTCDISSRSFKEKGNMRRHIHAKHPILGEGEMFPCRVCKKQFPNSVQLRKHDCCNEGNLQKFMCDICKESFPTATGLKKHRSWVHKPTYRHECPKCPRTFAKTCVLAKHMESKHEVTATATLADTVLHPAHTADTRLSDTASAQNEDDKKKPVVTCTWSLKPSPPRYPGNEDEMVEILSEEEENNVKSEPDWKPRIQSFGSVVDAGAWPDVDVKGEHNS